MAGEVLASTLPERLQPFQAVVAGLRGLLLDQGLTHQAQKVQGGHRLRGQVGVLCQERSQKAAAGSEDGLGESDPTFGAWPSFRSLTLHSGSISASTSIIT